MPSEFPIFEPCFTLQENLDRLADIDDPSHLKPISMTRIEAWLALLGVSFVNAVVIWALSFVADLSVMWIVIWSLTGFVMSWVCGVVGWVLHALVYRFWCCYYKSSDPRVNLFVALKMTIDHYDKLAQQFQCLQWAVHEGLVQARDVDRDLEYFGFYHEVLVGYHDYLLETLENDGWLGEYVTEDQTPFLALIPRLLEVQTGIEKWQDHYAKIMAKAVDLPDDAPEACR